MAISDKYLYGILYAYRNVPHVSTGKKLSFFFYGMDLHTPSEAAILPPSKSSWVDTDDYRDQVTLSLSIARDNAVKSIRKAQQRYKCQHDHNAMVVTFAVGQWVLIRFPADESIQALVWTIPSNKC